MNESFFILDLNKLISSSIKPLIFVLTESCTALDEVEICKRKEFEIAGIKNKVSEEMSSVETNNIFGNSNKHSEKSQGKLSSSLTIS